MLQGFEEYTHDLTDEETDIARKVWKILNEASGPITNKEICKTLKAQGIETTPPRVRKMINWMHIKGHLTNLIASSKGYHFAETKKELNDYVSSLRGRILAIQGRWKRAMEDLKNWEDPE